MKTRAQAQHENEQPPENVAELQRLKELFEKRPVVRKLRIRKQKPRTRHNRKVYDVDMERIRIMRTEHKLTYKEIGLKLHLSPLTVFYAWKRYRARQNQHIDARQHNGRSTPRKITPEISAYLMRQETLQQWSGKTIA